MDEPVLPLMENEIQPPASSLQTLADSQIISQQTPIEDQQNTIGQLLQMPGQQNGTHLLITSQQTSSNGQHTILHLSADALSQMGMTVSQTEPFSTPLAVIPLSRIGTNDMSMGMVGMSANMANVPRDMTTFMNL